MIEWKIATLKKSEKVAVNMRSLLFDMPGDRHRAGQSYDIRLTSEDGYQAERAYSAANPPEDEGIVEFGVQLLENGEVSPYLWELKPGDQVEVRGPIGGHFVWDVSMRGPLCLIGGGSGMVPLISMLRHHFKNLERDKERQIIFLVSARSLEHVIYRDELEAMIERDPNFKLVMTLTHAQPEGWIEYKRLIDAEMLSEVFGGLGEMPAFYVCGPTSFVEVASRLLVSGGVDSHAIRTERFGGADPE